MGVRYVLSLPEAYDRRKKLKEQFDLLGLNFELIEAKRISEKEIMELEKKREGGGKIGIGAIGCFCSHIEAWKKISENSERGGFVFEDDAKFSSSAYNFICDDEWIPECVDVCQLSYWPSKKHPKGKIFRVLRKREIGGEDRVHKLIHIFSPCPWGTQGYWISKRAAERALKMVDYYFKEPVDSFLFSRDSKFWKKSQVYSLTPAVVTEFLEGTSMRIAIDSATETVLGKDVNADLKRSKNLCGRLSDKFICLFCDKQYHGFE